MTVHKNWIITIFQHFQRQYFQKGLPFKKISVWIFVALEEMVDKEFLTYNMNLLFGDALPHSRFKPDLASPCMGPKEIEKIWGSLSLPSRFKPDLGLFWTFGKDLSTSPGCDCSHTSPYVGPVGIEPTLTTCKASGLTARQAGPKGIEFIFTTCKQVA